MRERLILGDDQFVDLVIWQVPVRAPGSTRDSKYRLAYVVDGVCVLRFDHDPGTGDHFRIGEREAPCHFPTLHQLTDDFWEAVAR
ncbi:MAG TPA: DUF6516 family protein [Acetobacteraceae bacterium]|nr:DUF6516 family protein [Acetobacteraceae bacterium]